MLVRTLMIYQNHWPPKKGSNLLPTPRYTEGVLGCTSKEFYEELASVREMQSEVKHWVSSQPFTQRFPAARSHVFIHAGSGWV